MSTYVSSRKRKTRAWDQTGYGRSWKKPRTKYNRRRAYGSLLESKFLDSAKDQTAISATGNITTSLNLIAQGSTESTRVGRKVVITKIQAMFTVLLPAETDSADVGNGDIVRIIVYQDKQTNGANAAVVDILETAVFDSWRNLTNANRFRIFSDKMYAINRRVSSRDGALATDPITNTSPIVLLKTDKVVCNCSIPVEFSSTTGAITEMTTNNLSFLYISRSAVASVNANVRIRFTG